MDASRYESSAPEALNDALVASARKVDVSEALALIAHGAQPGGAPGVLHAAAEADSAVLIEALIQNGCPLDSLVEDYFRDGSGCRTAAAVARRTGATEALKLLGVVV